MCICVVVLVSQDWVSFLLKTRVVWAKVKTVHVANFISLSNIVTQIYYHYQDYHHHHDLFLSSSFLQVAFFGSPIVAPSKMAEALKGSEKVPDTIYFQKQCNTREHYLINDTKNIYYLENLS